MTCKSCVCGCRFYVCVVMHAGRVLRWFNYASTLPHTETLTGLLRSASLPAGAHFWKQLCQTEYLADVIFSGCGVYVCPRDRRRDLCCNGCVRLGGFSVPYCIGTIHNCRLRNARAMNRIINRRQTLMTTTTNATTNTAFCVNQTRSPLGHLALQTIRHRLTLDDKIRFTPEIAQIE